MHQCIVYVYIYIWECMSESVIIWICLKFIIWIYTCIYIHILYACMYVRMCMYVCIHTYIHTYIHSHIHTYIDTVIQCHFIRFVYTLFSERCDRVRHRSNFFSCLYFMESLYIYVYIYIYIYKWVLNQFFISIRALNYFKPSPYWRIIQKEMNRIAPIGPFVKGRKK